MDKASTCCLIHVPHPSLSHPSRLLQSPGLSSLSHSKFPLAIYFTYGKVSFHVSFFIHLTLSFPALGMSISLFSMCVSPLLPCKWFHQSHLSRFHIYVLVYIWAFWRLLLYTGHWVLLRDTKMFSRLTPRLERCSTIKLALSSHGRGIYPRVMGKPKMLPIKRKAHKLGRNWLSFPLRRPLWAWNLLISGLTGYLKIHPKWGLVFFSYHPWNQIPLSFLLIYWSKCHHHTPKSFGKKSRKPPGKLPFEKELLFTST